MRAYIKRIGSSSIHRGYFFLQGGYYSPTVLLSKKVVYNIILYMERVAFDECGRIIFFIQGG